MQPIEDALQAKQDIIDAELDKIRIAQERAAEEERLRKQEIAERNQKRRNWLFNNGFLFNGVQFTRTINGNTHLINELNVENFDTEQWKSEFFDAVRADLTAEQEAQAAAQAALAAQAQPEPVAEAPQEATPVLEQPASTETPNVEIHFTDHAPAQDYFGLNKLKTNEVPAPAAQPSELSLLVARLRGLDPVNAYKIGRNEAKQIMLDRLNDPTEITRMELTALVQSI